MAIAYFENYKFDNTGGAIAPTSWNSFYAAGTNNVTTTYTSNGYSLNGLDLSVTASSATHGSYYAVTSPISTQNGVLIQSPGTNGRLIVGFNLSQYPTSGTTTIEPKIAADTSFLLGEFPRVAFNSDGSHLVLLRYDSSTSINYLDLYVRTAPGASTYTFSNITNFTSMIGSSSYVKFSPDGLYFAVALQRTTGNNVLIYKRNTPSSNVYTNVASLTTSGGVPTSVTFMQGNSLVVGVSASPFIKFFFKTLGVDTWTVTSNPASLPSSTITYVTAAGVAGTSYPFYVFAACTASQFIYCYNFTSATPTIQSFAGIPTQTQAPSSMAFNSNGILVCGYTSSPFIRVYNMAVGNGNEVANPMDIQPTNAPTTLQWSADCSMLWVGFNGAAPLSYKFSINNPNVLTNVPNPMPSGINSTTQSICFSADNQYIGYGSSTTTGQFVYTYDQQINVPVVITNASPTNSYDNYAYASNGSRLSVTLQNDIIGVRYYSSLTGGSYCLGSSLAGDFGFTDANWTNAYIEIGIVGSATSSTNGSSVITYRVQNNANPFGSSAYSQLFASNNPYYSLTNAYEFNTFLTSPIALTFKRDINTSTGITLNTNITDVYALDFSGSTNFFFLGPVTVTSETLVSDASKQWSSSTGSTSYQILDNNPPNLSQFVSSSTSGTIDMINVDNSIVPNTAFASKTATTSGISVIDQDLIGAKNTVSTSFSEIDAYSDMKNQYLAYGVNTTGFPAALVYKLTPVGGSSTQLTLSGGTAASAGATCVGMNQDGSHLLVAYSNLTGRTQAYELYTRNNDVYTFQPSVNLTEVSLGAARIVYSYGSPYVAIYNGGVYIYKIVGNTYTYITTLSGSYTSVIFSKGGKYLFLGSSVGGSSVVYSINTSTDTFTLLSGQVTVGYNNADTCMALDGSVEYFIGVGGVSPYVYFYKINNDDTFTLASNAGTQANFNVSNSVTLSRPTTSVSSVSILVAVNNATTPWYAGSWLSGTNTVQVLGSQSSVNSPNASSYPSRVNRCGQGNMLTSTDGVTSKLYYWYASSANSVATATYRTITLPSTSLSLTAASASETFLNSSQVGYKYT